MILKGLDEGWLARVEPMPIGDELAALATGRRTYELRAGQLIERTWDRLATEARGRIHVEHVCGGA